MSLLMLRSSNQAMTAPPVSSETMTGCLWAFTEVQMGTPLLAQTGSPRELMRCA